MSSEIFGYLAMATSLSISCIGFPMQVWKNFKRKTCDGLSMSLVLSTLAAYTCWTLYGFSIGDKFIFLSQFPGVLFSLVVFCQYLYYRRPILNPS